jgi:succinate dehydrogenase / fumarate reductase iron-sulfur subunit
MERFFEMEKVIHPKDRISLVETGPKEEHLQSPEERSLFEDDIKCIMCACCVSACPVNQKEDLAYIGPAAIVRAHRYIFDSRVKDIVDRLKILDKPHGVWSCKNYYKCTRVCPKGIEVTKRILEVKQKILTDLRKKSLL